MPVSDDTDSRVRLLILTGHVPETVATITETMDVGDTVLLRKCVMLLSRMSLKLRDVFSQSCAAETVTAGASTFERDPIIVVLRKIIDAPVTTSF